MKVRFKKIDKNAIMARYNHATDSGIDFFALDDGEVLPETTKMVRTGLAWEPEKIHEFKTLLKIEGRSGLGSKGIDVFGGVVDQDYRGEIKIILHNSQKGIKGTDAGVFRYNRGDKVAQGIIHLIPDVQIEETVEIDETDRGEKGFGSSGK